MGFSYNGISSQSMKIRAHLTGWQVSRRLGAIQKLSPARRGLRISGPTAESGMWK